METATQILNQLKQQGARITKARRLVVEVLERCKLPLTEAAIRQALVDRGQAVNKTTVYRELEYLRSGGVVRTVDFSDGIKRYEMNRGHHHHLICTKCDRVDDVHINDDVDRLERQVKKQKRFVVMRHSLEFFGLCARCAK